MKITTIITAVLLMFSSFTYGQSQSRINFQAGTIIEVQTGASVCADTVRVSGTFTGGGTICGLLYTVNLTALMEGFYDSSTDLMVSDTATVLLRNGTSPYDIIDSAVSVLNSAGNGAFAFANPVNGTGYYIVFKHRNSIETWSNQPIAFSNGSISYDFTTAASQAYGDNLILKGAKYTIYSGDVNQDGVVDASDLSLIDNDALNFVTGYVVTDVNGDNIADGTDEEIADNNAANFVTIVTPQ